MTSKHADTLATIRACISTCRFPPGTGQTLVGVLADAERIIVEQEAEIERLHGEQQEVLAFMDGVRNAARNRNPDGATILDFMACWNDQYLQHVDKLQAERDHIQAKASEAIINCGLEIERLQARIAHALALCDTGSPEFKAMMERADMETPPVISGWRVVEAVKEVLQ